jgi:hypothetical protein
MQLQEADPEASEDASSPLMAVSPRDRDMTIKILRRLRPQVEHERTPRIYMHAKSHRAAGANGLLSRCPTMADSFG